MDFECTNCQGSGYFDLPDDTEKACPVCHGTGGFDKDELAAVRAERASTLKVSFTTPILTALLIFAAALLCIGLACIGNEVD
jgi:RecJ-like exonuclease